MVNGLLLWRDYSNLRHGHGANTGSTGNNNSSSKQQKNRKRCPKDFFFFGWWYLANHMDHHECENPSGMPATDIEKSYDQGTPS
ncbi:hypothetical protein PGTUg99_027781 [Puccinia graminis f. sp. tritici]|uniref:Uncharacterized protein n=1 Tax=Puccinia graminis f. sp. tritici TaxID=56615 RepID=A0A5B0SMU3_PUCGR|nr:hypothetical protein PGTUg99_027781 [Puccinia graminis f. sp. tritici]